MRASVRSGRPVRSWRIRNRTAALAALFCLLVPATAFSATSLLPLDSRQYTPESILFTLFIRYHFCTLRLNLVLQTQTLSVAKPRLTGTLMRHKMPRMNQREYERLKEDAAAEYRRKLEAIEVVWKMTGGAKNGAKEDDSPIGKGALQEAIKTALQFISGDFTLRDVEKQIQATNSSFATKIKRPSLSSALKRMAAEKDITLVEAGIGKRASKFRRN
jgi:hypothetical protein